MKTIALLSMFLISCTADEDGNAYRCSAVLHCDGVDTVVAPSTVCAVDDVDVAFRYREALDPLGAACAEKLFTIDCTPCGGACELEP